MNQTLIQAEDVSKYFGKVVALSKVDIEIRSKEILGLVGDNAAGKSTFIKILSGIIQPDSGNIYFGEKKIKINNVMVARKLGIETLYQDSALADDLRVYENVFLSREPFYRVGPLKFKDSKSMIEETKKLMEDIGLPHIDPSSRVEHLSGGEKQSVAIARAMRFRAKILLFDEPTNHLSLRETERFLDFLVRLKEKEISSVFVSHNLAQVYPAADRFVVLERGKKIADIEKRKASLQKIGGLIRGKHA